MMAANVASLPDRAIRSWGQFAAGVTDGLIELGRDAELVKLAVAELRPHYIKAYEGHTVPGGADPDDAMAQVNAWITGIVFRLLFDLAEAKLDLLEARSDTDPAAPGAEVVQLAPRMRPLPSQPIDGTLA